MHMSLWEESKVSAIHKDPASRAGALGALFLFAIALMFAIGPHLAAQTSGDAPRKVKTSVTPTYPELAKRLNLSGLVRVEVHISPDGKVKSARTVGGHPVLASEAEKAALSTEFEAGSKETTQVLEFHFGAGN